MMNLHEAEEIEYQASRGDRLWSADPTDCCGGMHQLGVCLKVEAEIAEMQQDDEPMTREELVELHGEAFVAETEAILARADARWADRFAAGDEPF
jgi:hypothetical protein